MGDVRVRVRRSTKENIIPFSSARARADVLSQGYHHRFRGRNLSCVFDVHINLQPKTKFLFFSAWKIGEATYAQGVRSERGFRRGVWSALRRGLHDLMRRSGSRTQCDLPRGSPAHLLPATPECQCQIPATTCYPARSARRSRLVGSLSA